MRVSLAILKKAAIEVGRIMPSKTKSSDNLRRINLRSYATKQFQNENRCDLLANIVNQASLFVMSEKNPASIMIDDIEAVLIGKNMREGRGHGQFFAGNVKGAKGFKPELRDQWNQVQHAAAGIVIGYKYGWLGYQFAKFREKEPQDDRLYDATCQLGRMLNDNNYFDLANKLRKAIGDITCQQ